MKTEDIILCCPGCGARPKIFLTGNGKYTLSCRHELECGTVCLTYSDGHKTYDAARKRWLQFCEVQKDYILPVFDPDKIICPHCGQQWDISRNETERFAFCPHCGEKIDRG